MKILFKNADVFGFGKSDILTCDSVIAAVQPDMNLYADAVFDLDGLNVFPGFTDVHVHLREPGFSYKETISSGTAAAAHGGFTTVFSMPNLKPVPDTCENLEKQLDIIKKSAAVRVLPYGSITEGENGEKLSRMKDMSKKAIAFSDDGRGVQSDEIMRLAMNEAKSLEKIIAAHCEDNSLLKGGYVHDGEYAKAHGMAGICSESEWKPIKRDLALAAKTGCAYHVCHVSCKESVELIRRAKAVGVDVTCETAPHYLVLNDENLKDSGAFKMNPPIRSERDRQALIYGLKDGTVDMIATDHAPHCAYEKSGGLRDSLNGVVGLETAFPVLYTKLVKTGVFTVSDLVRFMSTNPNRRFLGGSGGIEVGKRADFTAFDLAAKYTVNPDDFLSAGKSTPFEGMTVYGACMLTVSGGKIAWKDDKYEAVNI